MYKYILIIGSVLAASCKATNSSKTQLSTHDSLAVKPLFITEKVFEDSDDPAIWINKNNLSQSLILGTDKHNTNGGIYTFSLNGKIDTARTILGMQRVNNIDVAYGIMLNNKLIDIAVATERGKQAIRVVSLPDVQFIDGGYGIPVFEDATNKKEKETMGIALYTRPSDNAIYAIVGRKTGPTNGYLYQYLLKDNGKGVVVAELVRKFGRYSGKKEIESIAVDNELGFVYYSDEQFGIRKYYADPAKGNEELAVFGQGEFLEDTEGISIYKFNDGTGYILVSNQSANTFNVYPREGSNSNKHLHTKVNSVAVSTNQSDGSDVTSISLPGFEGGLFVAMSTDKTFQLYSWKSIATKAGLRIKE